MRYEKPTISMPKQLLSFAKKKTVRIAKERGRGENPNLSQYISDLIAADKEAEQKEAA